MLATEVLCKTYAVRSPGKLIKDFEHHKQVALKPAGIVRCIVTVYSLSHGLVQQLPLLLELCSQPYPAPVCHTKLVWQSFCLSQ